MGGAWNDRNDFKGIDKDASGNVYLHDLLTGTGFGIRTIFLGFLLKTDIAWSFNLQYSSPPKFYFSVGADL